MSRPLSVSLESAPHPTNDGSFLSTLTLTFFSLSPSECRTPGTDRLSPPLACRTRGTREAHSAGPRADRAAHPRRRGRPTRCACTRTGRSSTDTRLEPERARQCRRWPWSRSASASPKPQGSPTHAAGSGFEGTRKAAGVAPAAEVRPDSVFRSGPDHRSDFAPSGWCSSRAGLRPRGHARSSRAPPTRAHQAPNGA